MKGIIDRFEDKYAVIELDNCTMINIPIRKLPGKVKEGDIINIDDKITIDKNATEERKEYIADITKDLWE